MAMSTPFPKLRPRGEMGVRGPISSSSRTMADVAFVEDLAPFLLATVPTAAAAAA